MRASSIILPSSNPFAFPARAPGFDPTHPAAQNMTPTKGASVVCLGGSNLTSLLTGAPLAVSGGTPITAMGEIGPSAGCTSTTLIKLTNQSSVTPNAITFGAIFQLQSASVSNNQIINYPGNDIACNGSTWLLAIGNGNVGVGTGATPGVGIPCFVCASAQSLGVVNFIAIRLDTGAILNSFTGTTVRSWGPAGPNLAFGTATTANAPLNGSIAAAMMAYNFLSFNTLQMWAADPWAFWYPYRSRFWVGVAAAAAFQAAWAVRRNFVNRGVAS